MRHTLKGNWNAIYFSCDFTFLFLSMSYLNMYYSYTNLLLMPHSRSSLDKSSQLNTFFSSQICSKVVKPTKNLPHWFVIALGFRIYFLCDLFVELITLGYFLFNQYSKSEAYSTSLCKMCLKQLHPWHSFGPCLLFQAFCSAACHWFGVVACKIHAVRMGFALPVCCTGPAVLLLGLILFITQAQELNGAKHGSITGEFLLTFNINQIDWE